jgi:deoxyribodipyrimidine photolyase-related protein
MSDFPRGPWCETWDALFWNFIGANRDYFAGQHRLSMIARNWDTFGAEKQKALRARAARFLEGLR